MRIDPSGAPLIALPCALALLDIAATLLGQPAEYWQGDRSASQDANPLVRTALGASPWLALPAALAWCGGIAALMLTLPPPWRRRLYLFLCIAHLVFAAGWTFRWSPWHGALFLPAAAAIALLMHRQILRDRERTKRNPA